jgi:hypothetical protein
MRESYFWPLRAVLMFALVLVLATSAWAQGGKKTEPKDKVSKDSYAVVEVNGALSVTTTDAAKKLKKEKAAEYKREVQRWNREEEGGPEAQGEVRGGQAATPQGQGAAFAHQDAGGGTGVDAEAPGEGQQEDA